MYMILRSLLIYCVAFILIIIFSCNWFIYY